MNFNKNLLNKLEFKLRRFAIPNLMQYIVFGMLIVFLIQTFFNINLSRILVFDTQAILQGELWRIITFIFIPPPMSLYFFIFTLYFYWLIGMSLESEWGTAKFNLFYLCGMIGVIISGLITGYGTSHYINMSLFLAFAALFPNFELRLFFVIPVKIKYLALLDILYLLYEFITSNFSNKMAIIFSLLNLFLFFSDDFIRLIKQSRRRSEWKKNYRR